MRVLVFGDIHGNLPALEKLFRLENGNFDAFICHGDIVNYGPWSEACVRLLTGMDHGTLLKGNHEDYFIAGKYPGQHPVAKAFFDFCYPKFDPSLVSILTQFGQEKLLGDCTVKHTIGDRYIFEDTDIADLAIDRNYIIGHSHQQYERHIGNYKLCNTGSLGQNRKYIDQSCYLIADTEKQIVARKSFICDIDRVINQMKSEKYPEICTGYYLSKARHG